MQFIKEAEAIAHQAMMLVDPSLAEQYTGVIRCLALHPELASGGRGGLALGSEGYIRACANSFEAQRRPKSPKPPSTQPDYMVSVIMAEYFGVPDERLEAVAREHQLSMGAENIVGDLLERYLASVLEPHGWIWCAGSLVKAVDFIRPPKVSGESWRLLQVKNRDNSENSSSSAIRLGTPIEKWHRTFSKTGHSNWENFPDIELCALLSESGFERFVRNYLRGQRHG
jgi:hypothetical protein